MFKYILTISISLLVATSHAQETPPTKQEEKKAVEMNINDKEALDDLNERIVTLLKGMDTLLLEDFIAAFITQEEIERMIEQMDEEEEVKQKMREHPQREFLVKYCEKVYTSIRDQGAAYGIKWKDLEKNAIESTTSIQNGIGMMDGRVTFWEGNTLYGIMVQAMYIDKKYCIGGLDKLTIEGGRGDNTPPPVEIIIEDEIEKDPKAQEGKKEQMVIEQAPEPELTDIEKYGGVITEDPPIEEDNAIVSHPDEQPSYPGGPEAVRDFVAKHLVYPPEAAEKNIEGRVYIAFVVEKDGSLTDIKVARGLDEQLDQEALRVVKLMPKWIPGKKDGKAVRTNFALPIKFTTAN